MSKIVRVDTLDNQTLDIELDNNNLILLDIASLLNENSSYSKIGQQALLPRPLTDGERIYWEEGPSLSLGEILTMLET